MLFNEIATSSVKAGDDIIFTSGRSTVGHGAAAYVDDALADSLLASHPRFVTTTNNGRTFRAIAESGQVATSVGGAKGDGTGDDRPAIADSFRYAAAIGANVLALDAPSHRLSPVPTSEINYQKGPQPCLVVPVDTAKLDGRGTVFKLTSGRGLVCGWWYAGPVVDLPIVADVAAGDCSVTLATGLAAQLAVGDHVTWMLGDVAFDPTETYNWGNAVVTAIDGDLVTLDRPINKAQEITTGLVNAHLRKAAFARDAVWQDFRLESDLAEVGISMLGGERLAFERITGRNLGAAMIGLHYVDGATIVDCTANDARFSSPSSGAAFSFAECRNIAMIRPRSSGMLNMIRAEAGAEISVRSAHFDNTLTDAQGAPLGTQVKIFTATGRSKISLHDTTISGFGGYLMSVMSNGNAGEEGSVHFSGRTRLVHPTDPYQIPIQTMSGLLDMEIGGTREIYNLDKLRVYRRRFNLRDGQYRAALGPMGILVRARVYCSPGLAIGAGQQLNAFTIGRQGDNGGNAAQGAYGGLQAGVDVQLDISAGGVAGIQWIDRLKPLQLTCATTANGGLDAANEFVEIEAWMAEPDNVDRPLSEADWRGAGSEREVLEARFAGYDLPPVPSGGVVIIDLPIPAMQASDFIESVGVASGLSGLAIRSADALVGMARITFENPTEATIDKDPADIGITFSHSALGA